MVREQPIEDLEDSVVMQKLDTAYLAHELEHSEVWKIVRDALKQKRDEAQAAFKKVDPLKNPLAVAKIQWTLDWCDHFIEKIFEGARKDGELALLEAQDRELIPESPSDVPSEDAIAGS